jgi:Ufm1-specific protease 2
MVNLTPVTKIPPCINNVLSGRDVDSLPETLLLLRDPTGRAIGVAQSLPENVALPGGISPEMVRTAHLKALPFDCADDGLCKSKPKSVFVLCFQSRAFVTKNQRTCELADAIRSASLLLINNTPFLGDGTAVEGLVLEDSLVMRLQIYSSDHDLATAIGPNFVHSKASDQFVVNINAIGFVATGATLADVKETMAEAVERQYNAAQATVAEALEAGFCAVDVKQFLVSQGLPIALCTVSGGDGESEDEEASVARRLAIHRALMLPEDRQLLRRKYAIDMNSSGLCFDDASTYNDGGWEGRLADVHIGIKDHGLGDKFVSVHMVRGRYLYCHYMQDKFNDSGWGCAYRSLQTLLSWCVSEGYASFPGGVLPSHGQIQQSLVDVGDKPASFVGSREWIGANEVCYALEALTGLSSKILHVSRGSEMESKGRELARHFDEQGSPVMVGGGVLAWTILGVARDSRTGRTRFLILDPHFEGRDDIATIHGKGWVAWKSADVFSATAFYNLCLPTRPSQV